MIDKKAYYVDKTNLIADILNEQVVLYTRPRRRFGKTLNMSMLYYFFLIEKILLFVISNISKAKC